MKVTNCDFHLPEDLIALSPTIPRDSCRLLVLSRDKHSVEHRRFHELPEFLQGGDLLLLNDAKVFPARLTGKKRTGGKIEILLVKEVGPGIWNILSKGRYTGRVVISDELSGEMSDGKVIRFDPGRPDLGDEIWRAGQMPLPPYIKRMPSEADKEWYQTVYADKTGSIAAPTAGLHFTKGLIEKLENKGVMVRFLTLHVGTGTFKPVTVDTVNEHTMDREYFEIGRGLIDVIEIVKRSGRRVITVGTTTTRALEGFMSGAWLPAHPGKSGNGSWAGSTDIFIYPGYRFRVVDSLITNFHLPRSTPLMLTSALCGVGTLMDAYHCAMSAGYRFFSYGDAMLIL